MKCGVKRLRHRWSPNHRPWRDHRWRSEPSTLWKAEPRPEWRWSWTSRSKWPRTCWSWSAPELCWWRGTASGCWWPARPAGPGREPEPCCWGAPPPGRPSPRGRVLCCSERWSFPRGSICRCTPWCSTNRELGRPRRLIRGVGAAPGGRTPQTLQGGKKQRVKRRHAATFQLGSGSNWPGSSSLSSNSALDVTASALGAWMTSKTEPEQHSTQPSLPSKFKCSFKIQDASRALRVNNGTVSYYTVTHWVPRQPRFNSKGENDYIDCVNTNVLWNLPK